MNMKARKYRNMAKSGDPCGQPLDRGTGGAQLQRWYWNQQSQCCLPFSYCGQKGTQNNFLSKQDCDRTCYEEVCIAFVGSGSGLLNLTRFYFNPVEGDCFPFDYRGAQGNENNFLTKKMCQETCKPSSSNKYLEFAASFCLMRADPGPCGRKIKRYSYDRRTGTCKKFIFGGCQGNLNNFESLEKCTEICCDKGYI
ncbi:unnamed protein product [Caenorhabditis auriculariae]|uniref:BPTI/Kunitz inhibitor domain-containing protein n=1 Tax=Caenorhabditis auriculariae TaxID=2777116 RepID=A0A8S1GZZ4_9PELO|nr:unnamed protein product [Caenorhabditis auriculariae]